jgi:hypothetical protein
MFLRQIRAEERLWLKGPGSVCCLPDDFPVTRAPLPRGIRGQHGACSRVHTARGKMYCPRFLRRGGPLPNRGKI